MRDDLQISEAEVDDVSRMEMDPLAAKTQPMELIEPWLSDEIIERVLAYRGSLSVSDESMERGGNAPCYGAAPNRS